ncbi:MAG: glutamate 5-kinase [Bacteroidales bacterium]|jgi:glutamate 5-kinase|nr:glutamate 5-kinase [Bacteroidales bacterium]
MMYKRITLKVGSNVLTLPDGHPNEAHIAKLVEQIVALRSNGTEVLLVSSGAIASGRKVISAPKCGDDAVSCRQLWAAVGQVYLIRLYSELFARHHTVCSQVLATKEDFRDRRHFLNMRNCLEALLHNDVLPIINENDVVSVTELMFTDNDELSGLITDMTGSDALIILTNVDGIYDGHPSNPSSKVIPRIEPEQTGVSRFIAPVKSNFGRGGMLTKFSIAKRVAASGTPVHIANGFTEHILQDIIGQKSGTVQSLFVPGRKTNTFKKWLAHSDTAVKGAVYINAGAAERLHDLQAASLLLVGVIRIEGDFLSGDVVHVLNEQGQVIGLGRSEYSADTARKKIGERNNKPLIHYDYLYLRQ